MGATILNEPYKNSDAASHNNIDRPPADILNTEQENAVDSKRTGNKAADSKIGAQELLGCTTEEDAEKIGESVLCHEHYGVSYCTNGAFKNSHKRMVAQGRTRVEALNIVQTRNADKNFKILESDREEGHISPDTGPVGNSGTQLIEFAQEGTVSALSENVDVDYNDQKPTENVVDKQDPESASQAGNNADIDGSASGERHISASEKVAAEVSDYPVWSDDDQLERYQDGMKVQGATEADELPLPGTDNVHTECNGTVEVTPKEHYFGVGPENGDRETSSRLFSKHLKNEASTRETPQKGNITRDDAALGELMKTDTMDSMIADQMIRNSVIPDASEQQHLSPVPFCDSGKSQTASISSENGGEGGADLPKPGPEEKNDAYVGEKIDALQVDDHLFPVNTRVTEQAFLDPVARNQGEGSVTNLQNVEVAKQIGSEKESFSDVLEAVEKKDVSLGFLEQVGSETNTDAYEKNATTQQVTDLGSENFSDSAIEVPLGDFHCVSERSITPNVRQSELPHELNKSSEGSKQTNEKQHNTEEAHEESSLPADLSLEDSFARKAEMKEIDSATSATPTDDRHENATLFVGKEEVQVADARTDKGDTGRADNLMLEPEAFIELEGKQQQSPHNSTRSRLSELAGASEVPSLESGVHIAGLECARSDITFAGHENLNVVSNAGTNASGGERCCDLRTDVAAAAGEKIGLLTGGVASINEESAAKVHLAPVQTLAREDAIFDDRTPLNYYVEGNVESSAFAQGIQPDREVLNTVDAVEDANVHPKGISNGTAEEGMGRRVASEISQEPEVSANSTKSDEAAELQTFEHGDITSPVGSIGFCAHDETGIKEDSSTPVNNESFGGTAANDEHTENVDMEGQTRQENLENIIAADEAKTSELSAVDNVLMKEAMIFGKEELCALEQEENGTGKAKMVSAARAGNPQDSKKKEFPSEFSVVQAELACSDPGMTAKKTVMYTMDDKPDSIEHVGLKVDGRGSDDARLLHDVITSLSVAPKNEVYISQQTLVCQVFCCQFVKFLALYT